LLAIITLQSPVTESVDLDRFKTIGEKLSGTSKTRANLNGEITKARGAADNVAETVDSFDSSLAKITDQLKAAVADEIRKVARKTAATPAVPLGHVVELPLNVTILDDLVKRTGKT
jgi:hypothetical protein